MLELMSNHSKEVIDELNAIGQTTFELQQSILYFILPMTNKLPKALKNIKYMLHCALLYHEISKMKTNILHKMYRILWHNSDERD